MGGSTAPMIDPAIKLVPIINPVGKFIVSPITKLTLLFLRLFCIPKINNRNKEELYKTIKNSLFSGEGIFICFRVLF